MIKKPLCFLITSMLLAISSVADAGTCRSGDAAIIGAQAGYENEINQINKQSDNSKTSSDLMGKCISGVTGVIVMPTFPDLGAIWQEMIDKVCKTASDRISDVTNGAISDVNNQINGLMNGITNKIDDAKDSALDQATKPMKSNDNGINYGKLW
jgi:TraL protein